MNALSDSAAPTPQRSHDIVFMREAIAEARRAWNTGEVPVGAIIVREGEVIARGFNKRETRQDPLGHAEIDALSEAARALKHWRLSDCTLYVTLEPCIMCAGALLQARIGRVVYGSDDPKGGALYSLYAMAEDPRLNHRYPYLRGVLHEETSALLSAFFQAVRDGTVTKKKSQS